MIYKKTYILIVSILLNVILIASIILLLNVKICTTQVSVTIENDGESQKINGVNTYTTLYNHLKNRN